MGRLGLSLQGMADVLGTDTRLIRRWESGQRPLPPEVAAWLEAAAAVPLPAPSWFERPPAPRRPSAAPHPFPGAGHRLEAAFPPAGRARP